MSPADKLRDIVQEIGDARVADEQNDPWYRELGARQRVIDSLAELEAWILNHVADVKEGT